MKYLTRLFLMFFIYCLGSCNDQNGRLKRKKESVNETPLKPESKQAMIRPSMMVGSQSCDPSCCYCDEMSSSSNLDYYPHIVSDNEIFNSLRGIRFGSLFNPRFGSHLSSIILNRRRRPSNGMYVMNKDDWRIRNYYPYYPRLSAMPFLKSDNFTLKKNVTQQQKMKRQKWNNIQAAHKLRKES